MTETNDDNEYCFTRPDPIVLQIAGVRMNVDKLPSIAMNNPVIHDQSNVIRFGSPVGAPQTFEVNGAVYGTNTRRLEDRQVIGGLGGGTQRTQTFGSAEAGGNRSMSNVDTHGFINYEPSNALGDTRPTNEIPGTRGVPGNQTPNNATGTVKIQDYMNWLRQHGYAFTKDS